LYCINISFDQKPLYIKETYHSDFMKRYIYMLYIHVMVYCVILNL